MSTLKNTIAAGLFGNALEWYDFILYANFAPIIATHFFPTHNPVTSLLLTFGVFATGFLVRPFGAVIFGFIGDHWGRRSALIASIFVMTFPTICTGLLPTYDSIGLAAPILLTLLRLFQGVAVSGELNSATTFLVEHAHEKHRGLAGCLIMGTAFLGILFGAFTAFFMTTLLTPIFLNDWGWRIPFWLGGFLGFIGILIRIKTKESPKFLQGAKEKRERFFRELFLYHKKSLLLATLLTCMMAVGNYIVIAYVVTFLVKFEGFSLHEANVINLISLFAMVLAFPLMGMLSDKIGRKPILIAGLVGFVLFSFPIFWLFTQKQFILSLLGDLLLCAVLVPIAALIPTTLAELFPTKIRNSGTALSYNFCLAVFGGTAPLVAIQLVRWTNNHLAPAGYLVVCAFISLIALYFMEETHHKALE